MSDKPYLLRARVAGDTIRDLIEALQQLDPDLKHGVEEVVRINGRCEGLGVDPTEVGKIEDGLADEEGLRSRYQEALESIRDAEDSSVRTLRQVAQEALQ